MKNEKMSFGSMCAVALGLCAVFSLAGCDDYKAPHKKPKSPTQGGISHSLGSVQVLLPVDR